MWPFAEWPSVDVLSISDLQAVAVAHGWLVAVIPPTPDSPGGWIWISQDGQVWCARCQQGYVRRWDGHWLTPASHAAQLARWQALADHWALALTILHRGDDHGPLHAPDSSSGLLAAGSPLSRCDADATAHRVAANG